MDPNMSDNHADSFCSKCLASLHEDLLIEIASMVAFDNVQDLFSLKVCSKELYNATDQPKLGSNSLRSLMKQFRASFIALVLALVIGPPIPCNGSFRVLVFHL
ncbi:uncharacterized protein G2W53_040740 [Senna tora]|uniref:Uncharacterized protein n=1 Tax=Senna tora TaxID=362788 RepID=A0A834SQI2_9FABA|nr:uncharacterized protein G2W53_040740 [Senna tora]